MARREQPQYGFRVSEETQRLFGEIQRKLTTTLPGGTQIVPSKQQIFETALGLALEALNTRSGAYSGSHRAYSGSHLGKSRD